MQSWNAATMHKRPRQKPTVGNRDGSSTKSNRAPLHWPTYENRGAEQQAIAPPPPSIIILRRLASKNWSINRNTAHGSVLPFHRMTRQLSLAQTTLVIIRSVALSNGRISGAQVLRKRNRRRSETQHPRFCIEPGRTPIPCVSIE